MNRPGRSVFYRFSAFRGPGPENQKPQTSSAFSQRLEMGRAAIVIDDSPLSPPSLQFRGVPAYFLRRRVTPTRCDVVGPAVRELPAASPYMSFLSWFALLEMTF